jgi:uncharacterized SAM-binding protein YcdF (DUF218 family)
MVYLLTPVLLMMTLFVIFAPGFLFSDNIPHKADAVVLFVGPGNEARLDEAKVLIKEGYARYLLIPYTGEIFLATPAGGLARMDGNQRREDLIRRVRMVAKYKELYENTHIEALEAKRMMDEHGLQSAMLVSSAYHMRRIRLIGGRVFNGQKYSIFYNPARWQAEFTAADWLDKERRKIIVSEYVKMGWFLLYGVFGV